MSQPLAGIKVVDLTHALAGPFCTHQLQLLGADVVKVEPPAAATTFRERPGVFAAINAGKRSITVGPEVAGASRSLRRLLADADVLVENYRPGVAPARRRLGQRCATLNPRLIYCSISGYGQAGPLRDVPAIEWAVQAMSGMTAGYIADDVDQRAARRGCAGPVQRLRGVLRHPGRAAPAPADRAGSAHRRGHARRGDDADGGAVAGHFWAARSGQSVAADDGPLPGPGRHAVHRRAASEVVREPVSDHRGTGADRRSPLCRPPRPPAHTPTR